MILRSGARAFLLVGPFLLAPVTKPAHAQRTPPAVATELAPRIADSLRALARGTAPAGVRAAAAVAFADSLHVRNDIGAALAAYQQAVAIAAQSADSSVQSNAHYGLGVAFWRSNQFDSALVHLEQARTLRAELGDRQGLGKVLNTIGATYYQLGIYEQALDAFSQSLDIRRETRDSLGLVRTLTNIGKTYHDWGQYQRARREFDDAVAMAMRVDSQVPLGYALNSLAMLNIDLREFGIAREQLARSKAAYARAAKQFTPSDSTSVWSLYTEAASLLLLREGRAAEALPMLDSLRVSGERFGDLRGLARVHLLLGQAQQALGEHAKARASFAAALEVSRRVSVRMLTLQALQSIASLEEASGNAVTALRVLRGYQALRDTVFNETAARRIAAMEARAATERQQAENALLRRNLTVGTGVLLLAGALLAFGAYRNRVLNAHAIEVEQANASLEAANASLRTALSEVRTLKGLIPICAWCKKVRDDQGYWENVESYVSTRSEATFSHGICQSCAATLEGGNPQSELVSITATPKQP